MQSLNSNYFQPNGFFSQSPKPNSSAQFHKTLQFHPKSHSTTHSIQSSNLPPHSLQLPIQSSSTPLKHLIKTTSQKLAIFLVGGLIFMGSFNCKSSLAVEKASVSETMEEIKDTQSENSEDSEEEMYVRMLKENPKDVQALKVVLSKMMTKGKTREAVKYVERLIEIEPDVVEWRLLQALTCEMMGALRKAKRLFKEILEENPLLLRALHGLAMVMHKNKEGRAVFEMLNKALELAQREKRVTEERNIRILIAQMHVIKGELQVGLKKFNKLVDENPRDFRPYLCQGIIYTLLNKKKEADEQFETYRSLVPQEFPDRGFLDDVVLAAKTESKEKIEEELEAEFSYKK